MNKNIISSAKNCFLKKSRYLEKSTRWSLFFVFSFVLWLKIVEYTSNEIYYLLLSTPSLSEFTKIQENAFLFFI